LVVWTVLLVRMERHDAASVSARGKKTECVRDGPLASSSSLTPSTRVRGHGSKRWKHEGDSDERI
jgi:hypothetical protein